MIFLVRKSVSYVCNASRKKNFKNFTDVFFLPSVAYWFFVPLMVYLSVAA